MTIPPSIIAPELWDAVQAQLQAGAAKPRRRTTKGRAAPSPLAGKLFDETGDRLTPSHTKRKTGNGSATTSPGASSSTVAKRDLSGWRLPAPMLEQTVVHLIRQHVDATTFSASLIHHSDDARACLGASLFRRAVFVVMMIVPRQPPCSVLSGGGRHQPQLCVHPARPQYVRCLPLYGGPSAFARMHSASTHRSACVDAASRPSSFWATPRNPSTAHSCAISPTPLSWLNRIKAGKTYEEIATEDAIPTDRVRKAIRYAFLAPDIVSAIVEGRQPVGLTSSYLLPSSASRRLGETASSTRSSIRVWKP